ncbi:MAG: hypothetical protein ISR69_12450 [Gammaproteobacteria bacterium]|nr:hypothetical protein [Gammaproteobacteria bacterium]
MKNSIKILAIGIALAVSNTVNAASTTLADESIKSAEKARKAAAAVGYEWRDTGLMIKKAKQLSAKGKTEAAIKLAKQAEEEGIDALNQYHSEVKRYAKKH